MNLLKTWFNLCCFALLFYFQHINSFEYAVIGWRSRINLTILFCKFVISFWEICLNLHTRLSNSNQSNIVSKLMIAFTCLLYSNIYSVCTRI